MSSFYFETDFPTLKLTNYQFYVNILSIPCTYVQSTFTRTKQWRCNYMSVKSIPAVLKFYQAFSIFTDNRHEATGIFQKLPVLSSTTELDEKISSNATELFSISAETLDDFLKGKFDGNGIAELMQIYTEKHLGEALCFPVVTPNVSSLFSSFDNPRILSQLLANYQSSVKDSLLGDTFLDLHTDSLYKFTLIRANFNLEENQKLFSFGYHHKTEHFRLFLKSSVQFDLTVVFEEL